MKHKILIAIAMIFFASCMKVKKKGDDDSAAAVSPEVTSNQSTPLIQAATALDTISYTYLASEKDGLDKIQFSKPINWSAKATLKKIDKENQTQVNVTFDENGQWTDFLTTENKVTYQFYSELGQLQEVQVLPTLNLIVKDDLNLAKKFDLNEKTKVIHIRYLGIEASKHLYLEDFSGQLIIDNVETSDGTIQTFPESSRAEIGNDGKNGGLANVKIGSGSGNLTIVMAGQAGGNGVPAAKPDAALKGKNGERGARADFKIIQVMGPQINLNDVNLVSTYACSVPPQNGGNGDHGKDGHQGNNGFKGGNSGIAIVENLSNALSIQLQSSAGKKGLGSIGGDGGEGGDPGPGGDGGAVDFEMFLQETGNSRSLPFEGCSPALPGARGGRGYQGSPGDDGTVGDVEKSCITNPDKTVNCIN